MRSVVKQLVLATILFATTGALAQSPPTNVFGIDFTNNATLGVSAAGHLRLRYNSSTTALEQSVNGGAYVAIGTGGSLPPLGPGPGTFTWATGDTLSLDINGRVTAIGNVIRLLVGGTGINPIGNLSADRTISVDQAFSPTWTGVHTFSLPIVIGNNTGTTKTIQFDNAAGLGNLNWNPSTTDTLTLPDATDTLVGRSTIDTLTNKTISGLSNTLTNIGNASLVNSSFTLNTTGPLNGGGVVFLGGTLTLTCTTCLVGVPTATGDLMYSTAGGQSMSPLADVAAGSYLRSGGVNAAPIWSTLTLPNVATTGDLLTATATNVIGRIADVPVGSVLVSGGVGVAPSWGSVPGGALPNVGPGPGSFTWATGDTLSLDAQGRVTTISNVTRTLIGGVGINNIGSLAADRTISIDQSFSPTWTGIHTYANYQDIAIITPPALPSAANVRFFAASRATGLDSLAYETNAGYQIVIGRDNHLGVRNVSGVFIPKGAAVYISGAASGLPRVELALADPSMSKVPALGIAALDIPNNTNGFVLTSGVLSNFNTSAFGAGNTLYVSPTAAGTLTNVEPQHPNVVQAIGTVEVANATTGSIAVEVVPINLAALDGVNGLSFAIGDGTGTAARSLLFKNSNTGTLTWDPSAARTLTLPDTTGTLLVSTGTLTANRIPVGTAGGALIDSGLTFSSNTLDSVTATLVFGGTMTTLQWAAGTGKTMNVATAAADTAGTSLTLTGGAGGASSAAVGGIGGNILPTAGVGGVGSASFAGGAGGVAQLTAGTGGAGTATSAGGIGGGGAIRGGSAGPNNGAGSGGGGTASIRGGTGATPSGANAGGINGGLTQIAGAIPGDGNASVAGGVGGIIQISGQAGGADNGVGGGTGSVISISTGAGRAGLAGTGNNGTAAGTVVINSSQSGNGATGLGPNGKGGDGANSPVWVWNGNKGGDAGAGVGTGNGGVGGNGSSLTITTGAGGQGGPGTVAGASGKSGDVSITTAGAGLVQGANGGASSGDVIISNGAPTGSATAGFVRIGQVNTGAVNIGRVGILTTINSNFAVTNGAANITANAASSFTTSAGALTITAAAASTWNSADGTVRAANFDRTTAGTLNIAPTVATAITLAQNTTVSDTKTLTTFYNGIGTTQVTSVSIQNTTAATNGAQQYSPMLEFVGQGFNGNPTNLSRQVKFGLQMLPQQQSAGDPVAQLAFYTSSNLSAYSEILRFIDNSSSVSIKFPGSNGITINSGSNIAATFGIPYALTQTLAPSLDNDPGFSIGFPNLRYYDYFGVRGDFSTVAVGDTASIPWGQSYLLSAPGYVPADGTAGSLYGLRVVGSNERVQALSKPVVTATPQGASTGLTRAYEVVAVGASGGTSLAGSGSTPATSTTPLTATNFVALTWPAVPGAILYDVYATSLGQTRWLGSTFTTAFNDTIGNPAVPGRYTTPAAPGAGSVFSVLNPAASGGVAASTPRTYFVYAVDADGHASAVATATGSPLTPSVAFPVTVTWNPVGGAVNYIVAGGNTGTAGISSNILGSSAGTSLNAGPQQQTVTVPTPSAGSGTVGMVRTSNVTVVNVPNGHGLRNGDSFTITSNDANIPFSSQTFTPVTVNSATQFQFSNPGANAATLSGSTITYVTPFIAICSFTDYGYSPRVLETIPVGNGDTTLTQIDRNRSADLAVEGQTTFRDSAGTLRYGVDANGLPSLGHRFEYREHWMWGGATSWTSSTHASLVLPNSSNVWILNSNSTAGSGFVNSTGWTPNNAGTGGLTLNAGTSANGLIQIQMGSPFIQPANVSNLVTVGEWGFAMSLVAANGTTYRHGWSHVTATTGTGTLSATSVGAWFESTNGAAWSCKTNTTGTVTTTVTTNVPVAATGQIFRIEQYGIGTPYGPSPLVKFFIDGTLVCAHTSNVYSTDTITWNITATVGAGAVSAQTASVGSVLLWANQIASPAAP